MDPTVGIRRYPAFADPRLGIIPEKPGLPGTGTWRYDEMDALLWPVLGLLAVYIVFLAIKKAIGLAVLLAIIAVAAWFLLGEGSPLNLV